MSKIRWRNTIRILFVVGIVVAGIVRINAGEISSGVSFVVASLGVVTVAQVLIWRRNRQTKESGMVSYDERDETIAGAAALFTVRIVLLVLSITMLVVFAVGLDWEVPIIVPIGIILFITSVLLRVSFLVLRRK